MKSWWKKDGVLKEFDAEPTEKGWEPAGGHYDVQLGVWIDDDPLDHDRHGKKGGSVSGGSGEDMKALRAEYEKKLGKKPFGGWNAETLRKKMA